MGSFQTFRREPYPAIDPTSTANSQAGQTVVITGGCSGVGRAIARAFVAASAKTVIIAARRADQLAKSVSILEAAAKGKPTILSRQLELGNAESSKVF
jgi:NAD(P)-dependent dehydrogenase (short-subunit alcohol dehydrogenase family)